ncbi:MAG TPA: cytochrome c family protein [Candidatus Aquilonibacter sp.]|nr:cytochrome c family protein [Candidatus Aquilonibacter sp.]
MDAPVQSNCCGATARLVCLSQTFPAGRAILLLATLVVFCLADLSTAAQGVVHLNITRPGGMPGTPVMTGIQKITNGVNLTWDGPSGYYQVWHKIHLTNSTWLAVGKPTNLNRTATITTLYNNDFFRVSGPAPNYAGSQVCISCHGTIHSTVILTEHAQAFTNALFIAQGGQTNASCLACHTVGYGLPTGFVSASKTPLLEGVQCENCHGPAANHAANPDDFTVIPQVEIAAQVCGGCHNAQFVPSQVADEHPSFFEDWNASPHSAVVPDVLSSMSSSPANINSCGQCHSGSARLALLQGQNPSTTLTNDYNVAITCAVCHDPHAQHVWTNVLSGVIQFTNSLTGYGIVFTNDELGQVYTNQLLCALSSTNDFVLTTSDVFSNTYNPNINVCAQCHNDRGAAWTDTSRSPHHSPQYNIMLGTVGEFDSGPSPGLPSTHSRLEKQCVECHMQTPGDSSGHSFQVVSYQLCYQCHSNPEGLVQLVTNDIAGQIQETQFYLNYWANNDAPAGLQKYGTLAWEYTTPGDLSPGVSGPSAADQTLIPDNIKKARYDLYLVLYDGSYGVHNAPYDYQLLEAAQTFVIEQLLQ